MKITCTENEKKQLCEGFTFCGLFKKNHHCDEIDGCCKCREENIEWEITDKKEKQSEEKEYSREDVIRALGCGHGTDCNSCKFEGVTNCVEVRNKTAIKYIQSTTADDEPNKPLTLYDLIDMMKEKKPVWIAGYGWFFIEKIVCDLNATRIVTHTQNNFIYTKDSTRFYRCEVK